MKDFTNKYVKVCEDFKVFIRFRYTEAGFYRHDFQQVFVLKEAGKALKRSAELFIYAKRVKSTEKIKIFADSLKREFETSLK